MCPAGGGAGRGEGREDKGAARHANGHGAAESLGSEAPPPKAAKGLSGKLGSSLSLFGGRSFFSSSSSSHAASASSPPGGTKVRMRTF